VRVRLARVFIAGVLLVSVPWLSVVTAARSACAHARTLVQPAERTMTEKERETEGERDPRQPLQRAAAGVARFYLRHSSAKGVRDEIYLRGGAVFVFSSELRTQRAARACVCACTPMQTQSRCTQWRFTVPRPFKQAGEILRRTLVPHPCATTPAS